MGGEEEVEKKRKRRLLERELAFMAENNN